MSKLTVVPFQKNESNPSHKDDVIRLLEEALERAKAGNYHSLSLIMLHDDGDILDCWHNGGRPYVMLGAIESLKTDFLSAHIQQR